MGDSFTDFRKQVRRLLTAEPETGRMFWKPRPLDMFNSYRAQCAWNGKNSGKEAFTTTDKRRLINLRSVEQSENFRNQPKNSKNTSGFNGVCWHKKTKKWMAYVRRDGKRIYLGVFENIEAAIAARQVANVSNGYHTNHGKDVV